MIKNISLIAILFVTNVTGQNLVTNPSFENNSNCPSTDGQINLSTPWQSARGTCDLYNICSTGSFNTPNNINGYQNPRTGDGYAGFYATQGKGGGVFEVREYLHTKLSAPLIAGKEYCVTFYVSLADELFQGELVFDVAVNDIGLYISTSPYTPDPFNLTHLSVSPQIINNSSIQILSDTTNWMEISGTYIAMGGEQYITIGSFSDEANQDTTWLDANNWNNSSYYYIDDVSVIDCTQPPLNLNINGEDTICKGETSNVNLSVIGGQPPYNIIWSNGLPSDSNQVVTPDYTTTYNVIVIDANNDSISSNYTVIVKDYCDESDFFVPNIFTPNGDNQNDVFRIQSKGLKNLECKIFTRWGTEINSFKEIDGFWDGKTKNGMYAKAGTYFYIVKAIDFNEDRCMVIYPK